MTIQFYRNYAPKSLTNKCLVLDLDETLVHTFDDMDSYRKLGIMNSPHTLDLRPRIYRIELLDVYDNLGTGIRTPIWGITRPYLSEFLQFCFQYFRMVTVWSAGQYPYVHSIVSHIFRDAYPPQIVFTRDDCLIETNLHKPLEKIFKESDGVMNLMNTFALDDKETTFSTHNPQNGVLIPEYAPYPNYYALRNNDDNLLRLKDWLMKPDVMNATDVRTLNKNDIFSSK